MTTVLTQALGTLACVAAVCTLASQGIISGSDALAVVSAAVGYFIHASGVSVGASGASPPPPKSVPPAPPA